MKARTVWTRMVVASYLVVAAWYRGGSSDPQWFADEAQQAFLAARSPDS